MRILSILFLFVTLFSVSGCDDDEATTVTIDSSVPQGFTVNRSGGFVAQNGTPTVGATELGTDENGAQWLRLSDDFVTEQGTGTVTVFLSTSDTYTASPSTGNPDLILAGGLTTNGEHFYQLTRTADADFTHVILWCASANIPFGVAEIQ